jgi:malonyl CoA-acyl carrier protein transacylase
MNISFENKYAIVGMGGVFPDAENINQFWQNIIDGKVSIKPVSDDKLDRDVFYRPDMYGKVDKKDKSYTQVGGVIEKFSFDGKVFRIPPTIAKHMDDNQKIALLSVQQALSNEALKDIDKKKINVIMGVSGYGELYHDFHKRFCFSKFSHHLDKELLINQKFNSEEKEIVINRLKEICIGNTFGITEDSAPGMLPSIIASRIASVYDLHGRAYTIDAACASGLAAILEGISALETGAIDVAICGAVDMPIKESGFIYFSGINALSPDGSFPFDSRANGFVIGQGGGTVIVKRLQDAVSSGDTIYAVVTGFANLSDGKGKAIAAPNSTWQANTIEQACRMANIPIDTIELIEAHGTSTQVGDLSEVTALKEAFSKLGVSRKEYCGLSSVKSNVGHLKAAAGIAGFIKASLAIHHKKLPPVAGFNSVNKNLQLDDSPFYVVDKCREWSEKEYPRRAGVSAFGFGGVNYHLVLEEYRKEDYKNASFKNTTVNVSLPALDIKNTRTLPQGNNVHTFFFSDNSKEQLLLNVKRILDKISDSTEIDSHSSYLTSVADPSKKYRLAFTAGSKDACIDAVNTITKSLESKDGAEYLKLKGVFYSEALPLTSDKIAFMFPGQGSQYADMLNGLSDCYSSVQNTFERADQFWKKLNNVTVSELINPVTRGEEQTNELLRDTRNTHPALFTTEYALFKALDEMGVAPKYMIGHSAGEVIALVASGAINFNDGLRLMDRRSKAFTSLSSVAKGAMAAVKETDENTQRLIAGQTHKIWIANYNSPSQTIVSGENESIDAFVLFCKEKGVKAVKLNVSQAFHSPLVEQAEKEFKEYLDSVQFRNPHYHVMCNEISSFYSGSSDDIKKQLSTQIGASVKFQSSIKKLYNEGVRLFIEIGPNSVLSSLVKEILNGKDCSILTSDFKNKSAVESFNKLLCGLFVAGIQFEPLPLKQINQNQPINRAIPEENVPQNQTSNIDQIKVSDRKEKIVYSGVSVGLPGSYKDGFRDDNFEQLFDGNNLIERLTDNERQHLVDLHVKKLVKSETNATFAFLDSINDVIQLAGKIGKLDLNKNYMIDKKEIKNMSSCIAHAIAAGYEALKDAHIPLVHEYTKTTSGAILPDKWALPKEMQKETGIIFANGFPMIDPIIAEVSRNLGAKLGKSLRKDIFEFYESLIEKVSDKQSRKILSDWYSLNRARISDFPDEQEIYEFNHNLMNQLASQANNRLAQYINAQGPNFLLLAACSSTATAVTISEELINSGRVKRMIVIGADDTANQYSLPYLGAAFLSTGACTNESDLYKAAVPFDKRRNGMIMGSGAIGIIVEKASECEKRGIAPVAELVGTHCFNTSGHHSQLDIAKYAEELEVFISRIEKEKGLNRRDVASQLIYMSHETYTPARGGCSQSEAVALNHVFGEDFRKIEISNTKGMTGHTMGASIEDAVAAKSLQYMKVPPVVNHKEFDPMLDGLKLSKGGSHFCNYALRMAAGFGSQGNYILLKKSADGDSRIVNKDVFENWLKSISKNNNPQLELSGRILTIKDTVPGAVLVERPMIPCYNGNAKSSIANSKSAVSQNQNRSVVQNTAQQSVLSSTKKSGNNNSNIKNIVLTIIAEITGYPVNMLDATMELEADLGVDTVKQATILSVLAEKVGSRDNKKEFRISDYPTIGHIVNLYSSDTVEEIVGPALETIQSETPKVDNAEARQGILSVIAEITGYTVNMLEPSMELEADLGVDTVKQATILSVLSERFGSKSDKKEFRISDYPTISHIIDLYSNVAGQAVTPASENIQTTLSLESVDTSTIREEIVSVIAEITGYPVNMLEPSMELEADLGVDTVKQATILSVLSDKFGTKSDKKEFRISDYPTIKHITELYSKSVGQATVPVVQIVHSDTPPAHSTDTLSISNEILSVIAEITGYPVEMLEPSMELEADLGVDTVKQATILSVLSEKFGATEKNKEFKISEYPTIKHLLELYKKQVPSKTGSIISAVLPTKVLMDVNPTKNENQKVSTVIGSYIKANVKIDPIAIMAENSDYAPEMLEDSLVLGYDLGFSKEYLDGLSAKFRDAYDLENHWTLMPEWTIGDLKSNLEKSQKLSISGAVKINAESINVARQILTLIDRPSSNKKISINGKELLILANCKNLAEQFAQQVKDTFAGIKIIEIDSHGDLDKYINQLGTSRPSVIIDLTAIKDKSDDCVSKESIVHMVTKAADCRYGIIKKLNDDNVIPERVLAITAIDGSFGITSDSSTGDINPVFGIFTGLYKGIRKEWKNCSVSILDTVPSLWIGDITNAVKMVLSELSVEPNAAEACYIDSIRKALVVKESMINTNGALDNLQFTAEDTIIVAGGASGITSRVVKKLSELFKTNFAIIGRTQIVDNVEKYMSMDDSQLLAQKPLIREKLLKCNSKVTPVMVENEFSKIVRSLEIIKLIDEIKSRACGIQYYTADIKDYDALDTVIKKIRTESGNITGIIHGAGIEISHLIEKKSLKEFHTVHSIKTIGGLNLTTLCADDPLKMVAAFSSISGRFGNAAQIDYSAANDFLNVWTRSIRKNRGIHAVSLNWSGWDETGMAFRNTFVRDNAEKIGLNLIDPHDGVNAAILEICGNNGASDVVIHRGLGDLQEIALSEIDKNSMPFIDRIDYNGIFAEKSHRVFSVARDAMIDQHRFSGVPLMPGVGYMEMMAEHLMLLGKQSGAISYRNMNFTDAFKLFKDKSREITLNCKPTECTDQWYMQISALFKTNISNDSVRKIYADAYVQNLHKWDLPFKIEQWNIGGTTALSISDLYKKTSQFKQNVIFGPLFSDMKRADRVEDDDVIEWNNKGCLYKCRFPMAQLTESRYPLARFLINPSFLDSMHQAGAILSILMTNQIYLPVGADEFVVVNAQKTPGTFRIYLNVIKNENDMLFYDMIMKNDKDEICYFIKNSKFRRVNQ